MPDGGGFGDLLWEPTKERVQGAEISRLIAWLSEHRGRSFASYDELWRWSIEDAGEFWDAAWEYFDLGPTTYRTAFEGSMEAQHWFPGAELNYAEQALTGPDSEPALICCDESAEVTRISRGELRRQAAALAGALTRLGVEKGDRVAAVLPNRLEATVAFLATASLGAVWSVCSPEFGDRSVVDRFEQIAPKVLIATDGYTYGGRFFDISPTIQRVRDALPSLRATIRVPADDTVTWRDTVSWQDCVAQPAEPAYAQVAFDHPLWVLYTSGTTGPPKPIVHGHGGVVLVLDVFLGMNLDVSARDRFFWHTTTGWVMWNILLGGLLRGATCVLFDGSPVHPDLSVLWRLAEREKITVFGVSAAYLQECMRNGIEPGLDHDLTSLRTLGSTGSPLLPPGYHWILDSIGSDVMIASISGGTDICSAWVGSCPLLPVYAGEIQCAALGAAVAVYDDQGRPVLDEVGELVIEKPFPSMPTGFWNDPTGERLHESYFDTYPGVWRHGDWTTETGRGTFIILGRSDATLNRGGIRSGTSEFYQIVEAFPEVTDSLVVDTSGEGSAGELLLFVVLEPGHDLTDELAGRIRRGLRSELSPRHAPDRIIRVDDVPHTLTGKKCEVPVKRILWGAAPQNVVSEGALRNPASLQQFVTHRVVSPT
jgi:acetoacetyl-CoA synthetase